MSNTINIFNTLPQQQSDSEDEGHQEKVQPQKGQNQNRRQQDEKPKRGQQQDTRQPQKQQQQKDQAPKGGRTGVQGDISKKEERDYHNHNKEFHKQQKDDLEKAHPNDRHSGHGGNAYGVKPKKGGAGKGNWGNYKGEENAVEAGSPVEGGQEAPKEEEKAELTLQEYYQQHRTAQNEPQINEAKAKITSEQLMKEMGTATLLKSRAQLTVDDRKAGQKKEKLNVDHHAAITTEHANLLNFRTGFIEKEYKPRDREEGGNFQKRDNRRREEREQEGEKPTTEVVEGQTGETQPVEGTQQETEQGREEHGHRRRGGYQGGYHGERRGYGGRGHRGGYGRRYGQEGEGEGRFQGDEQGEQGVSTGYTYKGGRGGNRQGGYRGGQNRNRERGQHYQPREGQQHYQPREGQQHHQPREGQQQQQPREGQQQQGGEQQHQPQRQEQQHHRGGQEHRGERPQGGRKPYGKGPQPKVNVADESAFPKLG